MSPNDKKLKCYVTIFLITLNFYIHFKQHASYLTLGAIQIVRETPKGKGYRTVSPNDTILKCHETIFLNPLLCLGLFSKGISIFLWKKIKMSNHTDLTARLGVGDLEQCHIITQRRGQKVSRII